MLNPALNRPELCRETKQAVAAALWDTPGSEVEPCLDFYFRYYAKQCELIALHDGGSHASVKTHQDIITIAQLLKESRSRDEICRRILDNRERPDYSVDLAARLLVMVGFGNLPYAYSGFKQIEWVEGNLKDFIAEQITCKPELGHDNINVEKISNGRNLGKIAGMEILWAANLADHLRLMKDDKAVAIFHHASFLKRLQK